MMVFVGGKKDNELGCYTVATFCLKSKITKRLNPLVDRLETLSKLYWVAHTGYG
ncbi:MAG: hypothetical protein NVS2B2_25960 [Ktedonobacteraceae bacterium]